jgi:type VI protein secretion system component Hcp
MTVQQNVTSSVVETLEGRQFLSAAPAAAVDAGAQAAGTGKVSMQDFHFVMRANKASPKLFAAEGDAAGISIVARPTKHTPTLNKIRFSDILVTSRDWADAAAAGKVSVQDFNFVMKVNKASPK